MANLAREPPDPLVELELKAAESLEVFKQAENTVVKNKMYTNFFISWFLS
jgi:hypothetical protein